MNEKEKRILEKIINTMIDLGIATEEEILLVTDMNGYDINTINHIIYIRTGHRNIEQVLEERSWCK